MLNKPREWDNVQAVGEREKLSPGGYVVEIKKVEVKTGKKNPSYQYLDLWIEIAEGEQAGFYKRDWDAQDGDKRWRGHYRQGIPAQDARADDFTARKFRGMVDALEASNSGYSFDWDEQKLVGKKVGALFRSEEWEYNGKTGWNTACMSFIPAERVRSNQFTIPAEKPLRREVSPPQDTYFGFESINDDDLPFN